ncbi:hypothetical protein [Mesorhizobium sp.]|uniref:hypothetical protein n=1 Tax=Mesorhizobium sp. TaxID=1871066 RepID=UPI0012268757|nr:hypothetical protein [Mesorhizobium sp.]TIN10402.1 MAG: hypothetical protein E5Y14_11105 [Mesorhizobium sp.]
MAIITDVEKLRPELLEISDAEFERRKAELEMAAAERQRRKEIAAKEAIAAQAADHVEAILAGVKFLHDNGILPEKLVGAFSRSDGTFSPATLLRAPTAESLVPRTARAKRDKPKRTRRVRDPKTGELVPSKASRG